MYEHRLHAVWAYIALRAFSSGLQQVPVMSSSVRGWSFSLIAVTLHTVTRQTINKLFTFHLELGDDLVVRLSVGGRQSPT